MAKKSTSTKTDAEPVVSIPVVPVVENVVIKKEKSKKTKVEEAITPSVESPLPLVVESLETADTEVLVTEKSVEFLEKLQKLGTLLTTLKSDYKILEKQWSRELKIAQKQSSKRKRKAGNRAPSGFVKPTRITDELAIFLNKPLGSEMARTEVTRDINKYIKTNSLQDKDNGRKINPDAPLNALLKLKKSDELTYFNLQRYMSPHFEKVSAKLVQAV
jgi:upstream activation factor subunit UAF30